jgi:Zn-dependent protease/CBS domain-containing protein
MDTAANRDQTPGNPRSARPAARSGFRLGRIFGIEIQIDSSWLFIFVLIAWNLAAGFASMHPEWGFGLDFSLAIVAAVVFFCSVLAHELSHSLVAQARGLPVRRITLFLFGGVSNIEREPTSPGMEFLISVVGPLSSLILGGVFLALGAMLVRGPFRLAEHPAAALSGLNPAATMLFWLGSINVSLGLFNLVPGFPLDGGRILRSLLWAATKDLKRATRAASQVGQLVGWIFVFAGLAMVLGARLPILGSGVGGGVWIALIGWFLKSAAATSYRQVVVEDLLGDIPVARLMRTDVKTVGPDLPVSDLVYDLMLKTDERALPVVDQQRLVGLVSLEDVRKLPREQWPAASVAQIMTPLASLVVAAPQQAASEALHELTSRNVSQAPVVENGRLLGLLRLRDVMRWLKLQE